ncbi:unnamed protein product [Chironomus riparius]|uniref:Beta-hexosaminidase n=1 Tax=Chironomus riparius TaxID=315576 RepID=A0A9N9S096_9DIPT|nr:unnamed protein product [Chironomus riparius]
MNMIIFKRIFIFLFLIFAFSLVVLYYNETKDLIKSPYLAKFKNIMRNSENDFSEPSIELSEPLTEFSDQSTTFPDPSTTFKPPITSYKSSRLRSIEESWTYECNKNRCTRKFYNNNNNNEEKITLTSCSLTCGSTKLWPKPTKTDVKTSFKQFKLSDIQHKIVTNFSSVAELMDKSIKAFLNDLKQIISSSDGNVDNNSIDNTNAVIISIHVTESDATLLSMNTDECYNLSIAYTEKSINVKITAKSFFGARHGLETLQQLIWYDDYSESLKILTTVAIEDCPSFNYRGLMLDTSRHYFSTDTIKRIIAGMSHVKLNRFHWHLTDSQSFPFVSKKYPELAIYGAYSSKEVYTHDDILNVVEFAKIRGIQIIPEIDAPAHSGNGWQWGKEKGLGDLSLCINQQPWKAYCGEPSCGQMNPKNKNSFMILESLYEELLQLTNATDFFHMGGDEVNFDCWKQHFKNEDLNSLWCDFMTEAHRRMTKANNDNPIKYATIWNSDWLKIKCLPAQNFTLQVWLAQPSQIQQFIKANYNLILSHVDAWYLDCGFGSWRDTFGQGSCPPFKAWYTVYNYRPWGALRLTDDQRKQILGGEACMWTEQVNEDSIDVRIWPRAAAFAERLWSDPQSSVIPKETVNRFSIFHKRFQSLGLKSDALFPKYCEQNEEECI